MTFDEWIAELGATEEHVGKMLGGVHRSVVSRVRRGKRLASASLIKRIITASNGAVTAEEMLADRASALKPDLTDPPVGEPSAEGKQPGLAVSALDADNHAPVVVAEGHTPHDERKVGDSVVIPKPPFPGMVPYWVNPGKPITLISSGLMMAVLASRALTPAVAATILPKGALSHDDVCELLDWLRQFEREYDFIARVAAAE